jgi:CO/xanthine dehydrogenase FAD-binding subunit
LKLTVLSAGKTMFLLPVNAAPAVPAPAPAAATEFVTDAVEVMGDYFASSEYRTHLARIYTRRALEHCASSRKK